MSVKIPLSFRTRLSKDGLPSIRLLAKVAFKSRDEYLLPLNAIIDIGAPVSMIPFKVWAQCVVTRGQDLSVPSITERPECDVTALVIVSATHLSARTGIYSLVGQISEWPKR